MLLLQQRLSPRDNDGSDPLSREGAHVAQEVIAGGTSELGPLVVNAGLRERTCARGDLAMAFAVKEPGIGRVAPGARKVADAETGEDRWAAGEGALALHGREELREKEGRRLEGLGGGCSGERTAWKNPSRDAKHCKRELRGETVYR